MTGELETKMRERSEWFEQVLGHPLNPLSNHPNGQMKKLFYNDLKVPIVRDRKTKSASLNDEALERIKKMKPVLGPLIQKIQEYRSLNTFHKNYGLMRLAPPDNRIRCSINTALVVTFRLSTNENIHGWGRNLQNIPKGTEKD